MDFTFTEEQETVARLARDLFERRATPERLTELEAGDVRYDAALWQDLAAADLLGTALAETFGGNGGGFLELGMLLAEVGRSVAPVPAYATLVPGADPIARHGTPEQRRRLLPGVVAGSRILSAGLQEPGRSDPTLPSTIARRDGQTWRLDGAKELVPAAQIADTTPTRSSGCAPSNSASRSGHCRPPPSIALRVSNSGARSATSRRCSSGWQTLSSTSKRSGGPPGTLRGGSRGVGPRKRPAGQHASQSSGPRGPVRESPPPPSTSTAGSASMSPIRFTAISCGPNTTN
jgi:hypothetical protein